eukprot:14780180-Alexandrium_andersonii.AAC.1
MAMRHVQVRCSDQHHTTEPSVRDATHEDAPDHVEHVAVRQIPQAELAHAEVAGRPWDGP